MRLRSARRDGFLLLPVVLLLAIVAAAAFALTLQGGVGADAAIRARDARDALWVAKAGLSHAQFAASQAGQCGGYALPSEPFGPHSYSASFTPAFGSPVSIAATGTLAGGVSRSVERQAVPVYEANGSLVLQPDASAGKDASIMSWATSGNYGANPELEPGSIASQRILIEFDLAALPAEADVRGATLELFAEVGSGVHNVHRLTSAWTEGSCVNGSPCAANGVTWGTSDGSTAWTAGGDFDPTPVSSASVAAGAWVGFDLGSLVQSWHAGAPNYGVMLYRDSFSGSWATFTSSDGADASRHPKLTIDYACECGAGGSGQLVLQPGVGGEDTYLNDNQNLENYGADSSMRLSNKINSQKRGLLRFDLSSVPVGAVVSAASLELNLEGIGSANSGTVEVFRVTESWVEGSGGGVTCWDGASWIERDGACGQWASWGASYDPTVRATAPIDWLTLGSVSWDLRDLVAEWAAGSQPNYGMLLIPSFDINHADFTTGDAGDPSLHPKLTVDYYCPCGVSCAQPSTWGDRLLLVVADAASLTAGEIAHRGLIESWGFVVTPIAASAAQADYDAASALHDVVFVTEDITASDLGGKLAAAPIGVVYEEGNLSDEHGVSESIAWASDQSLDVVVNTHYITQLLSLGEHQVVTSSESLADLTGALSVDLAQLGSRVGTGAPLLASLEQGGGRHDKLGTSDGRRVQLPWGGNGHDVTNLTDAGRTLLERSLQWAATPPPPLAGYLDRFGARSCDVLVDYATSHGSFDWSAYPWVETDDGDSCNGDVSVKKPGGLTRLQIGGNGTSIQREVDLSGFSVASLHFLQESEGNFDASSYLSILASGDGGATWVELGVIDASSSGSYVAESYSLTPLIAPNTVVRFEAVGLTTGRTRLDDVAILEETVAPVGCQGDTYRDEFNAPSYAGSDGTLTWSTDWLEVNEGDGPTSGDEQVLAADSSFHLRLRDNDSGGEGVQREADLSAATQATLSFRYQRDSFDNADDYVAIEASDDGGASWNQLGRIEGPGDDASYLDASFPLDAYRLPNARIRFLTSPTLHGANDKLYIDDVEICLQ